MEDGEVAGAEEGEEGWDGILDLGIVAVPAVERCVVGETLLDVDDKEGSIRG